MTYIPLSFKYNAFEILSLSQILQTLLYAVYSTLWRLLASIGLSNVYTVYVLLCILTWQRQIALAFHISTCYGLGPSKENSKNLKDNKQTFLDPCIHWDSPSLDPCLPFGFSPIQQLLGNLFNILKKIKGRKKERMKALISQDRKKEILLDLTVLEKNKF